ncbi:DUF1566 domain-containing protein [Pseudoalteromonas sp. MMG013]|uniref:Lcl C-terminal domain-containing protein n=1 Tax=Pseudoalteromonas sp. MMG013 TaxID=2822687 RepID=UPI001B39B4CE|nr:DUF1566 domain-containing protein [Pseudoalteromonas sp. MMG013]MBQ4860607.1 DUF1566 domain-containing protein [Pseudoalteromonas sp. MMG013]
MSENRMSYFWLNRMIKFILLILFFALIGCNYKPDDSDNSLPNIDIPEPPQTIELPDLPLCNGSCSCDEIVLKGNDTGIQYSAGYTSENLASCNIQDPFLQDCQVGRDFLADATGLIKVGFGAASFDYSKIANDGQVLPNDFATWQCVRDNLTNLTWEVKTQPTSGLFNASDQTYSYADPKHPEYSTYDQGECNNLGNCDTQKYIAYINNQNLCGYNDWRLPSKIELQDLVDYSAVQPAIDVSAFPNTKVGNYWTSTLDTDDTNSIWSINFNFGTVAGGISSNKQMIRLVRGKRFENKLPEATVRELDPSLRNQVAPKQRCNSIVSPTAPIARFKRDVTGEIFDTFTGLIWQACVAGQSGENCAEGEASLLTWQEALEYANQNKEQTNNKTPWRLPNIKELQRTIENQCEEPALNPFAFANVPMTQVWSATPHSKETEKTFHYQYQNSIIFYGDRTEKHAVHLVRDCQFN